MKAKPFLFYSDLHLRPERIDDCKRVLKSVGVMALKIQDKLKTQVTIINGGDTFNTRGLIHTGCFDVLYKEYESWFSKGLNQWIVVGNHDQEDKAGKIHPMSIFQTWSGWEVIGKPRKIDDFALFPYMDDRSEAKKAIARLLKEGAKDAVVHWGVKGAKRNDWNTDTDGIPIDWLKGFRKVYSGHYHFRNTLENLQYIGSPMQQSFAEREQAKGVIFYDQANNREKFYEIKGTPKHYEVRIEQEGKGHLVLGSPKDITSNDFLKLKISGDADFCKTFRRENYYDVKVRSAKIEREVKDRHTSRLNIDTDEVLSPMSLMEKYVDYIDTPLNKKQLLKFGKEIIDGVHG